VGDHPEWVGRESDYFFNTAVRFNTTLIADVLASIRGRSC